MRAALWLHLGLGLTSLGLALVCACSDKPSKGKPDDSPATEAKPAFEPELWALTCTEQLYQDAVPPPPPPPASDSPIGGEGSDSAGLEPLPSGPFPERHVKVRRPHKADYAARLGLSPSACDPQPLVELLEDHPREESLYCAISFAYEECGELEQATAWAKRRLEDFPDSADAQVALALRRLAVLEPEPTSGLPYNDEIPWAERVAIASQALAAAEQAIAIAPKHHYAHQVASTALVQRSLARRIVDDPRTPTEQLEGVLARKDLMASWAHVEALGKLQALEPCTPESMGPCIPPPPLSEEEQQADAALEAKLREQLVSKK